MRWSLGRFPRAVRKHVSTNGLVWLSCIILSLAAIIHTRGFADGLLPRRAANSPAAEALETPGDQSTDVWSQVGTNGIGRNPPAWASSPASGAKTIDFDLAAAPTVPTEPQPQSALGTEVTDFGSWTGTGVEIEFSAADAGGQGLPEDNGPGVDPLLDSTLSGAIRPNSALAPPTSIPEPDTLRLFLLGALVTGWWKARHRAT
jgi:hypothetical protein